MNDKITRLLKAYGEENDFFGNVDETDIENAEKALGMKFPQKYREFVRKYGSGGIGGAEITGIQGTFGASVVKITERWRSLGLDSNLIVIEDSGEFARCIYGAETNDDRVYTWVRGGKELVPRYENFDEYVIDLFQEEIDNM